MGNPTKTKKKFGWELRAIFEEIVRMIVEPDMKLVEREKTI